MPHIGFYDSIDPEIEQDKKHVEHVQDFWGDTLTAAGSQSTDGKAAYVQVNLAGNQGSRRLANESVDAVRNMVDHIPAPKGVKAYVTGAAPLIADQFEVGSKGYREGHHDNHLGDRADVAFRLPFRSHHDPRASHCPH